MVWWAPDIMTPNLCHFIPPLYVSILTNYTSRYFPIPPDTSVSSSTWSQNSYGSHEFSFLLLYTEWSISVLSVPWSKQQLRLCRYWLPSFIRILLPWSCRPNYVEQYRPAWYCEPDIWLPYVQLLFNAAEQSFVDPFMMATRLSWLQRSRYQ